MAKRTVGVGLLTREEDNDLRPLVRGLFLAEISETSPRGDTTDPADLAREKRANQLWQVLAAAGIEPPLRTFLREVKATEAALKEAELSFNDVKQVKFRSQVAPSDWAYTRTFPEDSIGWLAAAWLEEFTFLQRARRQLAEGQADPSTLSALVRHAEELGRLEERIFWRTTPVPGTQTKKSKGKSPEQLALSRLLSSKPLVEVTEGRAAENAERTAHAEEWQADAQELAEAYWKVPGRSKHPKTIVAQVIRPKLVALWEEKKSAARANGFEWKDRDIPQPDTIRRHIKRPVRA